MSKTSDDARKSLPADPSERDKFLQTSFAQAQKYYQDGQYEQAQNAFYTIWLTAGDYKGKTLKMYRQAETQLAPAAQVGALPDLPAKLAETPAPVQAKMPEEVAPVVDLQDVPANLTETPAPALAKKLDEAAPEVVASPVEAPAPTVTAPPRRAGRSSRGSRRAARQSAAGFCRPRYRRTPRRNRKKLPRRRLRRKSMTSPAFK